MKNIQAVCFDAFGTLCQINERHRPFEKLFARLGIDIREAAQLAMTSRMGLMELAEHFGDANAAGDLVNGLNAELASISLFDDVAETLADLRKSGLMLWVISNLAAPYGPPLQYLLAESVNGYSFSFEVGFMKPKKEIFVHACEGLSLLPGQVLMVGDSRRADIEGAENFGMSAVWLHRGKKSNWPKSVRSLTEIAKRLT